MKKSTVVLILILTGISAVSLSLRAEECHQERRCYNFGAQCEVVQVCTDQQAPPQPQFCTVIMELQGRCKRSN